jgi:hypothetical protein
MTGVDSVPCADLCVGRPAAPGPSATTTTCGPAAKALYVSSLANIAAYPSEEQSRPEALLDEKFAYAFPGSLPKTKG